MICDISCQILGVPLQRRKRDSTLHRSFSSSTTCVGFQYLLTSNHIYYTFMAIDHLHYQISAHFCTNTTFSFTNMIFYIATSSLKISCSTLKVSVSWLILGSAMLSIQVSSNSASLVWLWYWLSLGQFFGFAYAQVTHIARRRAGHQRICHQKPWHLLILMGNLLIFGWSEYISTNFFFLLALG